MSSKSISYDYGNPQQAHEFLDKINAQDRVALLSHTDHDGITSGYIMSKVVPDYAHLQFCDYAELTTTLAAQLRALGITKIITTDLFIKHVDFLRALEEFAEIMILDHHPSPVDLATKKITYLKIENYYCAAYMVYELFKDRVDLEQWDWFVASACIADYCIEKPQEWMQSIANKYEDQFMLDLEKLKQTKLGNIQNIINFALIYFKPDYHRVFKQIGNDFGDVGDLAEYANKVQTEVVEKIANFKEQHESFPGGYYFAYSAEYGITAMIANTVSGFEVDKNYVLVRIREDSDFVNISFRRQDKGQDMGKFVEKLIDGLPKADGGGHAPAAGGRIRKQDLDEFKRRLGLV